MSNIVAARWVGAFFLISTSSYTVASELIWSVLQLPDYLEQFFPNKDKLTLAALLEFVNSAAIVGIAVVIYPIIKSYNERIALGYIAFRIIEAVMLLVGTMALMSMITLSQELMQTTAANTDHFHTLARVLRVERINDFHMGMIPLAICGFLLNVTFYQYRIVPRWLSGLGLIGYVALLLKVLFTFFSLKMGGKLWFIPGGLFEFLLPLWLIFKGFNLSEKPVRNTA